MARTRLRFAVLMDIAISNFAEDPKTGISRYLYEYDIDAVYIGIGNLDLKSSEERAKMKLLELVSPREFDGILSLSTTLLNRGGLKILQDEMQKLSALPIVSIGPSILGETNVSYDNEYGTRLLMDHLIQDHHYTNFAYVSGPLSNMEAVTRLEAYRSALDEAGIEHFSEAEYEGNFLDQSGERAVSVLYDERKLFPQIIVCGNDLMAFDAAHGLHERGLRIPYDVAIAGYDDSRLSHVLSHKFTTVCQSFVDLGYLAAKKLHSEIMKVPDDSPKLIMPELHIKSSCGCIDPAERFSRFDIRSHENEKNIIPDPLLGKAGGKAAASGRLTRETADEWFRPIERMIDKKEKPLSLEKAVWHRSDGSPEKHQDKAELLRAKLYSMLYEEINHAYFLISRDNDFFNMRMRVIVDTLQNGLAENLSFAKHFPLVEELARICKARDFYFMLFHDHTDFSMGAARIYSPRASSRKWTGGPGHWFPDRNGSLVLNLVLNGPDPFAYLLIDADIPQVKAHEYFRVRFSSISRDMVHLKSIRDLNIRMADEIAHRKKTEKSLKEALDLVNQMSIKDELTGLYNRRGFNTLAEQQIKYLQRQKRGFIILYADLDGLKQINDTYGHMEGDMALIAAAEVLQVALRDSDIIARIGGDEFTALVHEDEESNCTAIEERLAVICAEKNRKLNRQWSLSITFGHAVAAPGSKITLQKLLDQADKALYVHKNTQK
ncbi:MAG: GGDEF domain-containing protein [Spirochaetales bacterium]|nr:GGDEF domain-containing protein [Spirochaetales bacterium]